MSLRSSKAASSRGSGTTSGAAGDAGWPGAGGAEMVLLGEAGSNPVLSVGAEPPRANDGALGGPRLALLPAWTDADRCGVAGDGPTGAAAGGGGEGADTATATASSAANTACCRGKKKGGAMDASGLLPRTWSSARWRGNWARNWPAPVSGAYAYRPNHSAL